LGFTPGSSKLLYGRGFTVVELLAVIVIAVVLLGIMFPVQRKIVHSSRSTRCISNLRQIYSLLQLYMEDHGNSFPPANAQNKMGGDWSGLWYAPNKPAAGVADRSPAGYAGSRSAMDNLVVCPENRITPPPSIGNPVGYPYCVNYNVMTAANYAPKRFAMILKPSATVLMTDSATGQTPNLKWNLGFNSITSGWTAVENRHENHLDILWVDGHASVMRKEDITDKNVTNK